MRVFLFTDAGNSSCFRVIHQCIWRICCDTADAGHVQKVRVHTSANVHFLSCRKLQSLTVDPVAVILISVQDLKFSRWCCWGFRSFRDVTVYRWLSGRWHFIGTADEFFLDCVTPKPHSRRNCSPSKLRALLTSLKTWLHELIGA